VNTAPTPRAQEPATGGRVLQEPIQTLTLLNRLRRHRNLLTAHSVDTVAPHSTLLLAVDAAQGLVHLDMLHPEPQHAFATDGPLWLRGRVQGGITRFRCRMQGLAIHDEGPVLRAALPDWIELNEQRQAWRLPIPDTLTMARTQLRDGVVQHEARLLDISVQGAAALAPPAAELSPGTPLDCQIELPGVHLTAHAEVRSCRTVRGARQRLGLRFLRLGLQEEDRLTGALHRLERQLIRSGRAA
jgi:hypothetical protein